MFIGLKSTISIFYIFRNLNIILCNFQNVIKMIYIFGIKTNFDCYKSREFKMGTLQKMAPNDDIELKDGFMNFLPKMFSREDHRIVREEFVRFVRLSKPKCKEDRATIAQTDPIGWWELYGDDALHLKHLAIRLLSQVSRCHWHAIKYCTMLCWYVFLSSPKTCTRRRENGVTRFRLQGLVTPSAPSGSEDRDACC